MATKLSMQELQAQKLNHQVKDLRSTRKNIANSRAKLSHLHFSGAVKKQSLARQARKCALCGKPFKNEILKEAQEHYTDDEIEKIEDDNDAILLKRIQYHHVLPRQFGVINDELKRESLFMKGVINCVALHESCHHEAHLYNYSGTAFMAASEFVYSHGEVMGNRSMHNSWVNKLTNAIQHHAPILSKELEIG